MRLARTLYFLCLSLGTASLGLLAFGAPQPVASAADVPAPRDAQAIWDKLCKSCHGTDGKGVEAKAKVLKIDATLLDLGREGTEKLTRDDHRTIVLEGKEKMPAYAKKVKPEEVEPLLDFVEKLADEARKNR